MNRMLASFLVGVCLFAVAYADYCVIVLSDTKAVFNVSDLTVTAYLPLNADDVLGVDISGNDFPNMPIYFNMTGLGPACREACRNRAGCKFYAYNMCDNNIAGACWLKTAMSAPRENGCRAYGVMNNSIPHDVGGGNYTMNLCRATPCASFTNCQICQSVGEPRSQWCTGNDAGAVYSQLTYPYNANPAGYDMVFYGDATGCPGGRPRKSTVHVVCNQPAPNRLVFLDEPATCDYEYEAYLTGNCTFTPPIPTLSFSLQTDSSVKVTILTDAHLFGLDYPLTISYNVWRDGNSVFSGSGSSFIAMLPTGVSSYSFTVQATYNTIKSAVSQPTPLTAVTNTGTAETIIMNMIGVLRDQVDQVGQQVGGKVDIISSRIDVDVVQVLRHTDDSSVVISDRLYGISNTSLASIATTTSNIQRTADTYNTRFMELNGKLDAQKETIQKLTDNEGVNTGKTDDSGSGVTGGGVAVGMLIGVVVGIIIAVVGPKIFQKLGSNKGGSDKGGFQTNHSLLDDEE